MATFTEPEQDAQAFVCATVSLDTLTLTEASQRARLYVSTSDHAELFISAGAGVLSSSTFLAAVAACSH